MIRKDRKLINEQESKQETGYWIAWQVENWLLDNKASLKLVNEVQEKWKTGL